MRKMRLNSWIVVIAGLCVGAAGTPTALAQRGMGDWQGVARSGVEVERAELSGTMVKMISEPCKNTTGRSRIGTHLLLDTGAHEPKNVHLGPADVIESLVGELSPGTKITVDAFRTKKMPDGHYVARQLVVADREIALRQPCLRPVWAGNRSRGAAWAARGRSGRGGPGWQRGGGRRPGRGPRCSGGPGRRGGW